MTGFQIPFPNAKAAYWAERYWESATAADRKLEEKIQDRLAPRARKAGFLARDDLLLLGDWKSRRPRKHYAKNDEALVKEVTRFALSTRNEELRIKGLRGPARTR